MKTETRLLIVDASTIIYRACHTHSGLTNSEGEFTGGVFGFIGQVCTAILRTGATHLLIAFDAPPYLKAEGIAETFKADRTIDEGLRARVDATKRQLHELIDGVGLPYLKVSGAEADDIIGHVCNSVSVRDLGVAIIMSGDSDMYQLLGDKVSMHKGGKHPPFYGEVDLDKEHGVPPHAWVNIISVAGSHNHVVGVRKGIGIKTAIKLLGPTYDNISWMSPEERKVFAENQKMNLLPFEGLELPPFLMSSVTWEFNPRTLYQAVARWEIRITEVMVEALAQISHRPLRRR
jgi:DNA polymerase-1